MRDTVPIQIIQGAQYGSEAKGAVAAYLCQRDNIGVAVRTGATNAGHTVVHGGVAFKMQQLPVGWVNAGTRLVLGPGAIIDMGILQREIEQVSAATGHDIRNRLVIDYRASIHTKTHQDRSTAANRHHLIGATGKGCSEALIDKIRNRGVQSMTLGELARSSTEIAALPLTDTVTYLNDAIDGGASVQLEGTQGTLLDLHLGPYPYVTHKPCGPAQWMMEAGLSPALPTNIILVARTYPIRVAGNSGPLPLEITWPDLVREMNAKLAALNRAPIIGELALAMFEEAVRQAGEEFALPPGSNGNDMHRWSAEARVTFRAALSEIHAKALALLPADTAAELCKVFEMTTVTRKLRRIARLSRIDLEEACRWTRPHQVVMTFMNYVFPHLWGATTDITPGENEYLRDIEQHTHGAPVTLINRGPGPEHFINTERGA